MKGILSACFSVLLGCYFSAAQPREKRDKFPSYFGLIAAPVFPTNVLGDKTSIFRDSTQTMTTTFNQKTGYMFGASVRIGLTKRISIETGLTQIRRNFSVNHSIPDSSVLETKTFSFVSYDIPINGLVYVQLTENIYMNAALGVSISHYPSDIIDTIRPGGKNFLTQEGRRIKRTWFSFNAGIGFEYRTEKSGTFYIGGAGKVPLLPIMFGVGIMNQVGTSQRLVAYGPVDGSYLSVDIRYYFPNLRNKGTQFKPGPIEQ